MNMSLFITLLTGFSVITSLVTEGVKKILDEKGAKYSSNVVASIVACIVGICGTGVYYVFYSIEFTSINIVFMVLMGVATWLCATVGYDKVIQTISQLKVK